MKTVMKQLLSGIPIHSCLLKPFFLVFALVPAMLLPLQAEPAIAGVNSLETLITSSFSGTYKTQIAKEGSDLQYLSKTFYGVQLGWPLVWYFNAESIPDPERIKAGTEIKIPRLRNGLDEQTAFLVLEGAYILAYKRYLSLANRSDGQRRWVLLQATESGCNLSGDIWDGVLSESDLAWSENRGIKVAAQKTVPLAVAIEPLLLADLVSAAAMGDEGTMGVLAAKFEKAEKIDDVIADLETKATAADAPPEVFLALSILYGRKGLRTKEYAALAAAETAAARPGVKFNVAVVYGRKQLLAGAPDADTFMVGSIDLESTPPGAIVFVDGVRAGVTPIVVDKVKVGVRTIRLESDGYKSSEAEFAVGVGAKIPLKLKLELNPKPGSISVTTNPPGGYVWLDREKENSQYVPTPAIFENIEPGEHTIAMDYQLIDNKLFLDAVTRSVLVLPGKHASVAMDLVQGTGSLRLTGFPEYSSVSLDGIPVDARSVFGSGYKTDAGKYVLKVTAPTGQKWTSTIVIKDEISFDRSLGIIYSSLARKTIKIDGKTDDWTGILPVWSRENHPDPFPTQTGTKMSKIYLCRDDRYLYWRVNYADGSPTSKLSADIKQRLIYDIQIFRPGQDLIWLDITLNRGATADTGAGMYNTTTRKGTGIAENCITYKFGEGVLEARLALSVLGKRLPEGYLQTMFKIANADTSGSWLMEANSGSIGIDYHE